MIDLTVSRILQQFNEHPDLLLVAETAQSSNKRKREVLQQELESTLFAIAWFLQYEKKGPIGGVAVNLLRRRRKLYMVHSSFSFLCPEGNDAPSAWVAGISKKLKKMGMYSSIQKLSETHCSTQRPQVLTIYLVHVNVSRIL